MSRRDAIFAGAALVALFLTVVFVRPVLPIDETRYLTVAWEMFLRQDWLAPLTVNFEPYHHKPPLLFWLINASWSVFGVSRWAATLPMILAAGGVVYLTSRLCRRLVPEVGDRIVYVLVGSLPFVLYGTLVMFDMTVTVFVLASLLCLVSYAESGRRTTLAGLGLLMGLGVLTKGPVMYLYLLFPILLGPWWYAGWYAGDIERKRWYLGLLGAFALSLLPVLAWLIPMLSGASDQFAHSLLWDQTAARVAGSKDMAHPRPFWFYLPILLLFAFPWLLWPRLWRRLPKLRSNPGPGLRLLAAWLLPTFVAFSLIGGKQPHYLLPLLPGLAIAIAWLLRDVPVQRLLAGATAMVAATIAMHLVLAGPVLNRYDLQPVADVVAENPDRDWAFARLYRGELTFLGRLDRQLDVPDKGELEAWFGAHPDGLAIVTFNDRDDMTAFEPLLTMPYRGKKLGVFAAAAENLASIN